MSYKKNDYKKSFYKKVHYNKMPYKFFLSIIKNSVIKKLLIPLLIHCTLYSTALSYSAQKPCTVYRICSVGKDRKKTNKTFSFVRIFFTSLCGVSLF